MKRWGEVQVGEFSERLEEQVEEVQPPIDEQVSDGQAPELINILILNLCGNIHDPTIAQSTDHT